MYMNYICIMSSTQYTTLNMFVGRFKYLFLVEDGKKTGEPKQHNQKQWHPTVKADVLI